MHPHSILDSNTSRQPPLRFISSCIKEFIHICIYILTRAYLYYVEQETQSESWRVHVLNTSATSQIVSAKLTKVKSAKLGVSCILNEWMRLYVIHIILATSSALFVWLANKKCDHRVVYFIIKSRCLDTMSLWSER